MLKANFLGIKDLAARIEKAPEKLRKEIGTEIRLAGDMFRDLAIKDAPADVGGGAGLRGSISSKMTNPLTVEVVVGKETGPWMEFGTKRKFRAIPGIDASVYKGKGTGSAEDALRNITAWVKRKGIKFQSAATFKSGKRAGQQKNLTLEQTGWLVFHFIMLNGVNPHPFFFKQIPIVRKEVIARIEKLLTGIV
jgi:bacteriophage HK97-gp10 putative tail-component